MFEFYVYKLFGDNVIVLIFNNDFVIFLVIILINFF